MLSSNRNATWRHPPIATHFAFYFHYGAKSYSGSFKTPVAFLSENKRKKASATIAVFF